MYFIGDGATDPAYTDARQGVYDMWDELNTEDFTIVENMQIARSSPGFDGGTLSPFWDPPTQHFARLISTRWVEAPRESSAPLLPREVDKHPQNLDATIGYRVGNRFTEVPDAVTLVLSSTFVLMPPALDRVQSAWGQETEAHDANA